MTERVEGKVAQVLNSREVALNVGSDKGVRVGMYFEILEHEDIEDPDSGDSLGSIDRPKVRVKVTHVQEKLSVAATYIKKRVNVGGIGLGMEPLGSFSRMLMPPKWITEYETLKTEEKTWEDLDEEESYVKIGDRVLQVIDESDLEQDEANND